MDEDTRDAIRQASKNLESAWNRAHPRKKVISRRLL